MKKLLFFIFVFVSVSLHCLGGLHAAQFATEAPTISCSGGNGRYLIYFSEEGINIFIENRMLERCAHKQNLRLLIPAYICTPDGCGKCRAWMKQKDGPLSFLDDYLIKKRDAK